MTAAPEWLRLASLKGPCFGCGDGAAVASTKSEGAHIIGDWLQTEARLSGLTSAPGNGVNVFP